MTNRFVGNDACRPCHLSEFERHRFTRHAQTLHSADRYSLGRLMPPRDRIPGTDIVLSAPNGVLQFAVFGHENEVMTVDFAFGSGKTGITYVSFMGPNAMELHKSYFPHLKAWYLTPGHEKQKPTDVAMMYPPDQSRQCVLCHAVTVADGAVKPEPRFFGVGCESCHGAGGAHVEAMKSGQTADLHMDRMHTWEATRLNNLCARCHRGRDDISMQTEQANQTNRFMPYGLMKSRCFLESGNRLSCLACHSPHTDASAAPAHYVEVCLSCHAGSQRSNRAPESSSDVRSVPLTAAAAQGKVCPVNRRSGCTGCHMPRRAVFTHSYVPTTMADHYIRVYRKRGPS